jgi:hypothetical protein
MMEFLSVGASQEKTQKYNSEMETEGISTIPAEV